MYLILMRHGEATAYQANDSTRHLTEFGKHQATETGEFVLYEYQPKLAVVSPYTRAQETFAAIQALQPDLAQDTYEGITPNDDAKLALQDLSNVTSDCFMVICHMDVVARMAGLMLDEPPEAFALAEARVYKMPVFAEGMAVEVARYVPQQP